MKNFDEKKRYPGKYLVMPFNRGMFPSLSDVNARKLYPQILQKHKNVHNSLESAIEYANKINKFMSRNWDYYNGYWLLSIENYVKAVAVLDLGIKSEQEWYELFSDPKIIKTVFIPNDIYVRKYVYSLPSEIMDYWDDIETYIKNNNICKHDAILFRHYISDLYFEVFTEGDGKYVSFTYCDNKEMIESLSKYYIFFENNVFIKTIKSDTTDISFTEIQDLKLVGVKKPMKIKNPEIYPQKGDYFEIDDVYEKLDKNQLFRLGIPKEIMNKLQTHFPWGIHINHDCVKETNTPWITFDEYVSSNYCPNVDSKYVIVVDSPDGEELINKWIGVTGKWTINGYFKSRFSKTENCLSLRNNYYDK